MYYIPAQMLYDLCKSYNLVGFWPNAQSFWIVHVGALSLIESHKKGHSQSNVIVFEKNLHFY